MGNPRVGNSVPVPVPAITVPVWPRCCTKPARYVQYLRVCPPPTSLQPRGSSLHTSIDVAAHFARYRMGWRRRRRGGDDPPMRLLLTHPRHQPSFVQHRPSFVQRPLLFVSPRCRSFVPPSFVPTCVLAPLRSFSCLLTLVGPRWWFLFVQSPPSFVPTHVLARPRSCSCLPTLVGPRWWFSFVQRPPSFMLSGIVCAGPALVRALWAMLPVQSLLAFQH